jgi:MFS family permease
MRGRLRRSLRASTLEGTLAEVVGACAGATVLTAWAMHLGAGAIELGALGALPSFGQLARVPGAWLTTRIGTKRLALPSVAASRLIFLLLVPLPLCGLSATACRAVLLAVATISGVLGVIGNCAWTVWMGDLVPARVRGRYFGRRTAICTLASTAAMLLAGLVLEAGGAHLDRIFAALALTAAALGAITAWLMAQQHQPAAPVDDAPLATVLAPLRDGIARRLVAYQLGWSFAFGLASPFFTVYMLGELGLGFAWVGVHGTALATLRVLTAPTWGRAIDRLGSRRVLVLCSLALALAPLPWLFASRASPWILCFDPLWVGTFSSGHGLAMFDLPLRVAPRRGRAFYLAAFATAGGLAVAVAGTAAGWLVVAGGGFRGLFVASACARSLAALLALRLPRRQSL